MRLISSGRLRAAATLIVGLGTLVGCSALDVSNPTRLQVDDLENSTGALYAVQGIQKRFAQTASSAVLSTGLLADEFFMDVDPLSAWEHAVADRRESTLYESTLTNGASGLYGEWQALWVNTTIGMSLVRSSASAASKNTMLGELFAIRGFAMLGLAEHICPGFPVRQLDANNLKIVTPAYNSAPQTTDSAFNRALADFDSALVYGADSARVVNLARIGKARALLGLGRFADAGTAAQPVDDGYIASTTIGYYLYWPWAGQDYMVSDREGGNGLNFVSAADPRVPLTESRQARFGDTTVMLYVPGKYSGQYYLPMVFANAIEARLIQAEAQIQPAEQPSGPWLETLNALRRSIALPDTTDPGTSAGRVDLLFRERAFWLFATGHRLGDLRRLISRYGRAPESVFPTGANRSGAPYGNATSLAFPGATEHSYNSAITGCTAR